MEAIQVMRTDRRDHVLFCYRQTPAAAAAAAAALAGGLIAVLLQRLAGMHVQGGFRTQEQVVTNRSSSSSSGMAQEL